MVWASALGVFTLIIVGTINAFYFAVGLPQWLWCGLPPVPGPPPLEPAALKRTGEKDCFPCCWPVAANDVELQAEVPPTQK